MVSFNRARNDASWWYESCSTVESNVHKVPIPHGSTKQLVLRFANLRGPNLVDSDIGIILYSKLPTFGLLSAILTVRAANISQARHLQSEHRSQGRDKFDLGESSSREYSSVMTRLIRRLAHESLDIGEVNRGLMKSFGSLR